MRLIVAVRNEIGRLIVPELRTISVLPVKCSFYVLMTSKLLVTLEFKTIKDTKRLCFLQKEFADTCRYDRTRKDF